ncbi:MAG: DUF6782 family putative metallopeptidase [Alphaproteobacteria bacterium]
MNMPESFKVKNNILKNAVDSIYNNTGKASREFVMPKDRNRIDRVTAILEQSPQGKYLLDTAKENNFSIHFEPTLEDMGVCSYEQKSIYINGNVNDAMAVSILAHELRHACQYSNGMNLYAESDNTKTQIQINRAMEADAEANAGFVALELKSIGFDAPWNEFKKDGPEVAKLIEETLSKNGGEIESNKSALLLAGFKGWYNDFNIREQYDSQQVEVLDKIRDENMMNIVGFDRSCPSNIIVRKICKTPEHSNYFDDNKESPDLLDTQHYLGISRKNMDLLNDYFEVRKAKHNIQPDDSLVEIPTYKYINEKKNPHSRGNTKSVYWESIIKIKKEKSKKLAIEENKNRYIEQASAAKSQDSASTVPASALIKQNIANLR